MVPTLVTPQDLFGLEFISGYKKKKNEEATASEDVFYNIFFVQ